MTVKELKEELSKYPDDMIVVAYGYEDGFDVVYKTEEKQLRKKEVKSWWEGKRTEVLYTDFRVESKEPSYVVLVSERG